MEEVGETIRPFLDMDYSTSCENSSSENTYYSDENSDSEADPYDNSYYR